MGETERSVISAAVCAGEKKKPRQYDSRQCRLSLQADPPCCHMEVWGAVHIIYTQ